MYQILHQTSDFLVINKLPGVSVHKDQTESGLVMAIKKDLGLQSLFMVHRLDKETSGLMVFALNSEVAAELAEQFRNREIEKYYLALSDRKPRRKQGAIVGDMEKSRRGAWKLLHSKKNPAKTQFLSVSVAPGLRLYLVKPATGKTHQIRVALKSEGAPILGDVLYSSSKADRMYLHAFSLAFKINNEPFRFYCMPDIGEKFDQNCLELIVEKYNKPESLSWPKI
ncbi:MAG: TIGR01621 family pseudouridine synthase [Neptuniibacter sp.]